MDTPAQMFYWSQSQGVLYTITSFTTRRNCTIKDKDNQRKDIYLKKNNIKHGNTNIKHGKLI
jgi:hypothetical protein